MTVDSVHCGRRRAARRAVVAPLVALLVSSAMAACSRVDNGVSRSPIVVPITRPGPGGTAASAATDLPAASATDSALVPTGDVVPTGDPAAASDTAPASPAPAPASSPAIDGTATLQAALDQLVDGYHFTTTITVDGSTAAVVDGDRIGDSARLSVLVNGTSASYVVTPVGSWVLPDGGEWAPLDVAPPSTDPLVALRTPVSISIDPAEPSGEQLMATVPAMALGLPGEPNATLPLTLRLDSAALRTITYHGVVGGKPATVESLIGPIADANPIIAPI